MASNLEHAEPISLGRDERSRLATCEQIIERGVSAFIEVGQALVEIRESRLYRDSHPTFEAYCYDRWQIRRSRAYELLDQAAVAGVLQDAAGLSGAPDISSREARDLKPTLPAVTNEIRTRIEQGEKPAEAVHAVVTAKRAVVKAQREERKAAAVERVLEVDPETGTTAEDVEPDPLEELEHTYREIERLEGLVKSLSADGLGAEYLLLTEKYARLEGRLQQELTTSQAAQRQARLTGDTLRKIRQEVGVEQTQQILAAIRGLKLARVA